MEQDVTTPTDPFNQIFIINEEIKSKPKHSLTKAIQAQINKALEGERFDLFKRLSEGQDKLSAPVKQGIAEYLIVNPEKGDYADNAIRFLKLLKGKARDKTLVQYLTTIALLRHQYYSENDGVLLKRWLANSKSNRKKLSKKIGEVICAGNFHWIVNMLDHCKEAFPEFDKEVFDDLKKSVTDELLALSSDVESSNMEQDLTTVEKLMQSPVWIETPRDQLLAHNIEACRLKTDSNALSQEHSRQSPSVNVTGHGNMAYGSTQAQVKKFPRLPSQQTIEEVKLKEDNSQPEPIAKQELKPEPTREDSSISTSIASISIDGLNDTQEKLIYGLVKQFISANRKTRHQIINLKKLKSDKDKLKITCDDFKDEVKIYIEENEKLTDKIDMLRRRLEKRDEAFESEKEERRMEKLQLEDKIADVTKEFERCRFALKNKEVELERERQLGHSTHRDAVNRADVELQSKLTQINQSVTPIFREFKEFEVIQDLPSRARMLLNIAQKLKNALRKNGVMI